MIIITMIVLMPDEKETNHIYHNLETGIQDCSYSADVAVYYVYKKYIHKTELILYFNNFLTS